MASRVRFILSHKAAPGLYIRRIVEALPAKQFAATLHDASDLHAIRADASPDDSLVVDAPVLAAGAAFQPEAGGRPRLIALMRHPFGPEGPGGGMPALAAMDRIIVTAPYLLDGLTESGVAPARIAIVEPGADARAPHPATDATPVRLLNVGALVPENGHMTLIDALSRLPDLAWQLTCAGASDVNPGHAAVLRDRVGRLGLEERVAFPGGLGGEALESLYDRADVFALTPLTGGCGAIFADALARGLPMALSATGPVPQQVPIAASVQTPPGEDGALAKALRRVICDAELRARMAEAAGTAGRALPGWADTAARFAAEIVRARAALT